MNRDDIVRMAREVGISKPWDQEPVKWETLERFAALVYAEGHKDGLDDFEAGVLPAAIKAEREACAALADKWHDYCAWEGRVVGLNIAKDIRARGSDETPRSS